MTHPDDELLSALIDGEAGPSDVDHADSCATCQARLSELRAVAQLVGRPVAGPPPGARDRAVAAAIAGSAPDSADAPWWRRPGVLAAAAVAALLAIATPVLVTAVGDGDGGDVALVSPAGPVVAGDLGDLAGGEALEEEVRAALSEPEAERTGPTPEAADDGSAVAGAAESDAATLSGAAPDPMAAAIRCEPVVRADTDDLAALVYVATGTWDGAPAVVMAFGRPDDDEGVSLYVLDAETCDILNWQRF